MHINHPTEPWFELFVPLYGLLARDPRPARSLVRACAEISGLDLDDYLGQLQTDAVLDDRAEALS